MDKLLKLLESDASLTPEDLAAMCKKDVGDIRAMIDSWEKTGVILGRQTLIDWDRAGEDKVAALIEIKINRNSAYDYDRLAQRIRNYPEVKSLYLMSGGFDFAVMVEGNTLKELAYFVGQKLAAHELVTSTATHFVLATYKENNVVFKSAEPDGRENDII